MNHLVILDCVDLIPVILPVLGLEFSDGHVGGVLGSGNHHGRLVKLITAGSGEHQQEHQAEIKIKTFHNVDFIVCFIVICLIIEIECLIRT
jgi:hypothetical protein